MTEDEHFREEFPEIVLFMNSEEILKEIEKRCYNSEEKLLKVIKEKGWIFCEQYYNLTEDFIIKYQNEVDWNYIFLYQHISEEFKKEFYHRITWDYLSPYQKKWIKKPAR